eukprot:761363-Hanusia_phi.AAC.6
MQNCRSSLEASTSTVSPFPHDDKILSALCFAASLQWKEPVALGAPMLALGMTTTAAASTPDETLLHHTAIKHETRHALAFVPRDHVDLVLPARRQDPRGIAHKGGLQAHAPASCRMDSRIRESNEQLGCNMALKDYGGKDDRPGQCQELESCHTSAVVQERVSRIRCRYRNLLASFSGLLQDYAEGRILFKFAEAKRMSTRLAHLPVGDGSAGSQG